MDDDPDGRRRDCVKTRNRQLSDAIPLGASRPSVLYDLSAPVLRFVLFGILHDKPFDVGSHATVLGVGKLANGVLKLLANDHRDSGSVKFRLHNNP